MDSNEALLAHLRYAEGSSTDLGDGNFIVEPRLYRGWQHVYAFHLLQALDAPLRAGEEVTQLEGLRIRTEITRNLWVQTASQRPSMERNPDLELMVSYANNRRRWLGAWQIETPIVRRDAVDPLCFLGSSLPGDSTVLEQRISASGWRNHPGLLLANCLQLAASQSSTWLMENASRDLATRIDGQRVLIHSAEITEVANLATILGHGYVDGQSISVDPAGIRPLKNSAGTLVPLRFTFLKGSTRCAAGTVNMAYV